jgi:hypothetical protein
MKMKAAAMIRFGMLLGFIIGSLMVLVQPSLAAGNEPEQLAKWRIEADMTVGEPMVNLIVEIGFYDEQGKWQQTQSPEVRRLMCEVNDVVWEKVGGPAIFNGDGYIVCEMLNVFEIATQMTNGEFEMAEQSGGGGTTVDADAVLAGYNNDNSIFYHPDIQFSAFNKGEASLRLEVGGLAAKSDIFMPESRQDLHGELQATDEAQVYFPKFAVDNAQLEATPQVLTGHSRVSHTYEGAIYFGYSPETDSYFEGEMYRIDVDPGCAGMG